MASVRAKFSFYIRTWEYLFLLRRERDWADRSCPVQLIRNCKNEEDFLLFWDDKQFPQSPAVHTYLWEDLWDLMLSQEVLSYHILGDRWVWTSLGCSLMIYCQFLAVNASTLSVSAFTVERYIAICHPMKAQVNIRISRAPLRYITPGCSTSAPRPGPSGSLHSAGSSVCATLHHGWCCHSSSIAVLKE